jgi:hypothetical protein
MSETFGYDPNPYDNVTIDEALAQIYDRVNDRTVRQMVTVIKNVLDAGGTGSTSVVSKTTAEWQAQPHLVSTKNTVYVYTDYDTSGGRNIPAIKIGDGSAYVVDLPFVTSGSITTEDVVSWNNKVTARMSDTAIETLELSKN